MIGVALGQHLIRESGAGILENVISLQPTSSYMLNDFYRSWELPSIHASIKSMSRYFETLKVINAEVNLKKQLKVVHINSDHAMLGYFIIVL